MLLVACAGNNSGSGDGNKTSSSRSAKNDENSKSVSSYYSDEYLELIKYKLLAYADEINLGGVGVDEQKNRVSVGLVKPTDEIMNKIEDIIGKEGMDACIFEEMPDYPQTT